jgi:hypothetical protein
MSREVLIILPNGQSQTAHLKSDRWTLGRSTDNDFGFPEDSGLSRQHLVGKGKWRLDRSIWGAKRTLSMTGSFTSTLSPETESRPSSDGGLRAQPPKVPQVSIVFDRTRTDIGPAETLSTSLNDVISSQTISAKPALGTAEHWKTPLAAFLRAGRELSQGRPLPELFEVILDLSIEAVGAERGVLMTLEGDRLAVQASRGNGFRISTTVHRVLNQRPHSLDSGTFRTKKRFARCRALCRRACVR